jgi:hypothetical protein
MSIQDEKVPVKVKFVKPTYPDGSTEVLAVFTTRGLARKGMLMCYAHVGQHSECCHSFTRRKLATKEEYLPLLKELENIGYVVIVVNKEKV